MLITEHFRPAKKSLELFLLVKINGFGYVIKANHEEGLVISNLQVYVLVRNFITLRCLA